MQSLTRRELTALLKEAKRADEEDWLIMAVAPNHGLRATEVIRIKPKDIGGDFLTVKRAQGLAAHAAGARSPPQSAPERSRGTPTTWA